ncbi:n-terminal domain-containing protein, partial [Cystoisospora suis]
SKHHPVSSSSSTVTGALGGGGGLASASSSSASGSAPNQQQEEVEAVWSLLLQFVQLAVGQPRQPITPLWLVGILLALDRVKPAKETTVS